MAEEDWQEAPLHGERPKTLIDRLDHPAIDAWIPSDALEGDPVLLQRRRIVSAFLQALIALALGFGTLDALQGLYTLSLTSFAGLPLASLTLMRMRNGAPPLETALASSSALFVVLVGNAALNGGLQAPAVYLLPLVPIMPLLLDLPRLAGAWVAACAGVVALARALEMAGVVFLPMMPPDHLATNRVLVVVAACAMVYGGFLLYSAFGRWMREQLLLAEAQRLDRILDAGGDAIVRLDDGDHVVAANPAARRLFGVDDLRDRHVLDLLPAHHQLIETDGAEEVEAMCEGGPVPVEASSNPVRDGRVLVIRDIRERVQAQEEVRRALVDAQAASVAKSRFLASMSHELRTPLNAVIGYAELIGEDITAGTPPTDTADIDHIVGSARHLLALIDQVLDLAKVEAGRMEVEQREVPLQPFLAELATIGRTLARARGNRWEADLPTDDRVILLDEVRARQIVLNLLSNAAKFCEDGVIRFAVAHTDDRLSLTVSDTGIGMTSAQLDAVWSEFVQADRSTHRLYGGTGLGLPLVRRLTELLGGRLATTSAPGEGSTFVIELPAPSVRISEAAPL
jgi:PAS domain S-box-containing protein